MAEVKITCPNCFSEDRCFESKMEIEDFSSYMCLIVVSQVIHYIKMKVIV